MNQRPAYPYEIHVTIEHCQLDHFKRYCGDAGVKPLLIALGNDAGNHLMCSRRMMTSDFREVITASLAITKFFTSKNLNVQRVKIETSVENPIKDSLYSYYEVHVPVRITSDEQFVALKDWCKNRWHFSRNAFKIAENHQVYFLTMRSSVIAGIEWRIDNLRRVLGVMQIEVDGDKIERESVLLDTCEELDAEWMGYATLL